MMRPILLLQADSSGLRDLSSFPRALKNTPSQVAIRNSYHYYDLAGNTTAKWGYEARLPSFVSQMTIEGWMYLTPQAKNPSINVDIIAGIAGESYSRGFYMGISTSGEFRFHTGNGTRHSMLVNALPVNQTFHFAWVLTGTHKKLYINGTEVASDATTRPIENPPNLTLGYMNYNNEPYDDEYSKAQIHQLIIWDGVKYTTNFTPEHHIYNRVNLGGAEHLPNGGMIVPSSYKGVIEGQTLELNIPVSRKVMVYHRFTGKLLGATWSDEFGNYTVSELPSNTECYVVSIDHERGYNAVVQDMIRTDK